MLKAYDYSEFNPHKGLHDEKLFQTEMAIAKKFVTSNPILNEEVRHCMVCQSGDIHPFSAVWGVQYYRCESCYTIFTPVEKASLNAYKSNKEMIEYRLSDKYQEDAESRRSVIWEDLMDWLTFRTFRYLNRNKELEMIDYGNRYVGLIYKLSNSTLCRNYELRDSIANNPDLGQPIEQADLILYLNRLQQSTDPVQDLIGLRRSLKDDGLLFLSTRVSTGFDILTLQQKITNVFPYEHVLLLSKEGIEIVLRKAGYKLLEISTPGLMDLQYVMNNKEGIPDNNLFIKYLVENGDHRTLSEFQRFLQKSGMSSFAQVVARKEV